MSGEEPTAIEKEFALEINEFKQRGLSLEDKIHLRIHIFFLFFRQRMMDFAMKNCGLDTLWDYHVNLMWLFYTKVMITTMFFFNPISFRFLLFLILGTNLIYQSKNDTENGTGRYATSSQFEIFSQCDYFRDWETMNSVIEIVAKKFYLVGDLSITEILHLFYYDFLTTFFVFWLFFFSIFLVSYRRYYGNLYDEASYHNSMVIPYYESKGCKDRFAKIPIEALILKDISGGNPGSQEFMKEDTYLIYRHKMDECVHLILNDLINFISYTFTASFFMYHLIDFAVLILVTKFHEVANDPVFRFFVPQSFTSHIVNSRMTQNYPSYANFVYLIALLIIGIISVLHKIYLRLSMNKIKHHLNHHVSFHIMFVKFFRVTKARFLANKLMGLPITTGLDDKEIMILDSLNQFIAVEENGKSMFSKNLQDVVMQNSEINCGFLLFKVETRDNNIFLNLNEKRFQMSKYFRDWFVELSIPILILGFLFIFCSLIGYILGIKNPHFVWDWMLQGLGTSMIVFMFFQSEFAEELLVNFNTSEIFTFRDVAFCNIAINLAVLVNSIGAACCLLHILIYEFSEGGYQLFGCLPFLNPFLFPVTIFTILLSQMFVIRHHGLKIRFYKFLNSKKR